ncbi:MAG: hypothetical protein GWN14_27150 [candidate division Zixibacteria bacterium]|nr:hypothetical protein [Gammaproteobacteria bacterium]NIX59503.1 hypothetical protein [candidate division Zixibacteria bacterium]
MKTRPRLFKLLFSRYLQRTALPIWTKQAKTLPFTPEDIPHVLESTWKIYHSRVQEMPEQANVGNWLVMHFGYLTLAAHQAWIDFGLDEETSIGLIQDLTWHTTSTWTNRARRGSKFIFRDQMNQLNFFVDLIMKRLFSPPGYQYRLGNLEDGFYLDVYRCPVAELMKSNEAAELCIQSWCGVDSGLAQIFGQEMKRTGTIAMGEEKCDFKFLQP